MDKKIVAIGGLSESGKSTAGIHFSSMGFVRLKIGKYYKEYYERSNSSLDFMAWSKFMDKSSPREIASYLLKRVLEDINSNNAIGAALESLYGNTLAENLRNLYGEDFEVLFISSHESLRAQRQAQKEKFDNYEDALEDLRQRDAIKVSWGALRTEEIADHVIKNNFDREVYLNKLNEYFQKINS